MLNSAGVALSVAVDPENRLLYIGEVAALSGTTNTGGLRVINYSTLVEVSGSPFATGGLAPSFILPLAYGTYKDEYVYVANRTVSVPTTGSIAGYSVTTSGTTYSLSSLSSSATAGVTPVGMAQDSTGNYLLVVNSGGSQDLQAYTFDATTGGKLDLDLSTNTEQIPVDASAVAAIP